MTMVTDNDSDKRREVAQRLRDFGLASDYACSDGAPFSRGETMKALRGIVADDANGRLDVHSFVCMLADLMDPTCHQVLEDETQVCSECGGDLDERYGWNYCPCCGARITEVS